MNKLLLSVVFLFLIYSGFAQSYSVTSKRAIQLYKAATQAYNYTQYDKCIEYLDEATEREPAFIEAWLLKAQVFNVLGKHPEEAKAYVRAIEINPKFYKYTLFYSAKAHFQSGLYEVARSHADLFLATEGLEEKDKSEAKHLQKQLEFAFHALANPIEIDPRPLSNLINGVGDVYWPSMTVDNSMFYFTARLPVYPAKFQEDIFVSGVSEDEFTTPKPLSGSILSLGNEGASFISPDGRFLLFTACGRQDGLGSCDLYISLNKDGLWDIPRNMGKAVNSNKWDSRPVISSDGKSLYFTSNRNGGKGRADLYMCTLKDVADDGYPVWSKPVNLGDSVNTSGDEFAPFIHADNQTLYFSSDYFPGMGGQDLFIVKRLGDNQWSKPVNLGYPINKHTDEMGLFIDAQGQYAYFATDQAGQRRAIFRFGVPETIKPQPVSHVKVFVKEKESYKPLSALVQLFDVESGDSIIDIQAEGKNGSALVSLPGNKRYGLLVEKSGYMFYSGHFDLVENADVDVKKLEVLLQPIRQGETVVLNNVFFKFDSFELSDDSKAELDRVERFLNKNPGLTVEIGGHTDNRGNATYNNQLSENRAKAVYDYLVDKQIPTHRLGFKGYGAQKPIAPNDNAKGRAQNRRTEMVIVEIK